MTKPELDWRIILKWICKMWAVMQLAVYRLPVARFLDEAVSLRLIQYTERGSVATTGGRAGLNSQKCSEGIEAKCKNEGKKQVT